MFLKYYLYKDLYTFKGINKILACNIDKLSIAQ